jgi:hypothetical protein
MYKVFNQLTGLYDECTDIDQAKVVFSNNINAFVEGRNTVKQVIPTDIQSWSTDMDFAKECYRQFFNMEPVNFIYVYSIFNLDNETITARCFKDIIEPMGRHERLIKVSGTTFLEAYESQPDEFAHAIAFDINTHHKTFFYNYNDDGNGNTLMYKYDYKKYELYGTYDLLASTYMNNLLTTLPEKYTEILNKHIDVKNGMQYHGQRPHGYIVEFTEKSNVITNINYADELAQFKEDCKKYVNVIYEASDENGNITTQIVGISDWTF